MDRKGFAIMAATGVVKIICNAGYLWIAPDAIGQHRPLVVHIKHCKGATVPQEGDKVMFDRRWNDTKGEYDIVNCKVTSGGGGTGQVVAFGGDTSFINNTIIDADPLKLFSSSSSSSAVPRRNRSRSPRNASDADDAYSNTDKGNNNAKDEGNGNAKGTGEDREVQANANDKGRNAKDKGNNNATFQYHWIAVHQIQCDMMSEPAPSRHWL